MNKLVSGMYGFEMPITAEKMYFPDILDLRGKRIKHIDIVDAEPIRQESVYMLPDNAGNIRNTLPGLPGFLTIVEANTKNQMIEALPFKQLNLSTTKGNRLFINKIIDLPQSFVKIAGITNAMKENGSLYFIVHYDEPATMNFIPEKNGRTQISYFEVPVRRNQIKNMLPDNRTLYNKKFQNLLLYVVSDDNRGTGQTPEGNIPITDYMSATMFLTLKNKQLEFIHKVPLCIFNQTGNQFPLRLQNIQFDFTNSFIEMAHPGDVEENWNMSVMFNAVIDDN